MCLGRVSLCLCPSDQLCRPRFPSQRSAPGRGLHRRAERHLRMPAGLRHGQQHRPQPHLHLHPQWHMERAPAHLQRYASLPRSRVQADRLSMCVLFLAPVVVYSSITLFSVFLYILFLNKGPKNKEYWEENNTKDNKNRHI